MLIQQRNKHTDKDMNRHKLIKHEYNHIHAHMHAYTVHIDCTVTTEGSMSSQGSSPKNY